MIESTRVCCSAVSPYPTGALVIIDFRFAATANPG